MGADFFGYYVPYEADLEGALQKLRKREFEAGRYLGAYDQYGQDENGEYDASRCWPPVDIGILDSNNLPQLLPSAPAHGSIDEAIEVIAEEWGSGTNSVLDLTAVSNEDRMGFAYRIKPEELIQYMGTAQPTREQFEKGFWDYSDVMSGSETGIRYTGYCAVIYQDGQPTELFFGGYTAD